MLRHRFEARGVEVVFLGLLGGGEAGYPRLRYNEAERAYVVHSSLKGGVGHDKDAVAAVVFQVSARAAGNEGRGAVKVCGGLDCALGECMKPFIVVTWASCFRR